MANLREREPARKEISILLFLILGLIFLDGCKPDYKCQDALGCLVIPPGRPLLIGVEKATTGDEQLSSQAMIDGLKFAQTKRPAFMGHTIEFYFQDAPCSPQERMKAASLLASEPDLAAVFGPSCQANSILFAKLLTDAGLTLISAEPISELNTQPGWFSTYPTLDSLVSALDQFIPASTKPVFIITQDRPLDILFTQRFCDFQNKAGGKCQVILNVPIGSYDLKDSPLNASVNARGTVLIIMPFSEAYQISAIPKVLDKLSLVIFDPELATLKISPATNLKDAAFITYSANPDLEDLKLSLTPDSPELPAIIASDSLNILLHALEEITWTVPDGSLIVPRQGLRTALGKIGSFQGLAWEYACIQNNVCLDPEQFLKRFTPKQ
jgi:branched-chain amino acid transport system substrate-binding protein